MPNFRLSLISLVVLSSFGCATKEEPPTPDEDVVAQPPAQPLPSPWPGASEKFKSIDDLIAAEQYEDAYEAVREARDSIAAGERIVTWQHDFGGQVAISAVGKHVFYYLLSPNSRKDAPGRQNSLEVLQMGKRRSALKSYCVCLEFETGQIRWTRQISGKPRLVVDPETDDVYLYYTRIAKLAATDGEILLDEPLPEGKLPKGLVVRGKCYIPPETFQKNHSASYSVYDTETKETRTIKNYDFCPRSEDERYVVSCAMLTWACFARDGSQLDKIWELDSRFNRYCYPQWIHGRPVFVLAGARHTPAMATALDPETGAAVWATRLAYNRYRTTGIGSGFLQDTVVPFGYAGDQLVVLDEAGTIHFLNPDTGEQTNTILLATRHLQVPFAFRDQLVISGWKSIRSYNYRRLLEPNESDDAALAIREARCLLELGRSEESLALLDDVTTHAPNNSDGWAARAAVSRIAGGNETGFSSVKALMLRQQESDPWAAEHDGLVKVIDVGAKPTLRWMQHQGKHYFGTFDGKIWECSPADATATVVKELDRAISYALRDNELASVLTGKEVQPEPSPNPEIPKAWFTEGGRERIGSAVKFKGREFRSMRGGRVRMLDGTQLTDLDPKFDGVDLWSLHASQHAAFGYGKAIYRVDENCVPVEPIASLEIEGKRDRKAASIKLLASDEHHVCAVAGNGNGHILQMLTPAGKLLIRHELCGIPAARHQESLLPLKGGFLHTDRRLTWITPQDGGRVWDFGPAAFRTGDPTVSDRVRYFSDPLISGNHLCVLTFDGQLLVFDIEAFTSNGSSR